MRKNKKGISLIVLIITIIVMIILAASVIISLSSSGIIFNANKAKEDYLKKDLKQSIDIVLADRKIDKTLTFEEALDNLQNVEVVQKAPDMCYVTKDNVTITVYDDGTIYDSKVEIWDGKSISVPEITDGNWYIYTPAELKFFQEIVNGAGTLTDKQQQLLTEKGYTAETVEITATTVAHIMANIDMGARQKAGELTLGTDWTPIGQNSTNTYWGTVEGNGHTILGIYIKTTNNFVGLFGRANGIKGLTIKNSYIEGNGCVGGIVGINLSGNIENCHNVNTKVVGNFKTLGGVIGQAAGEVVECTNSGTIITTYTDTSVQGQTGGVCGKSKNNVYLCTNFGAVSSETIFVGGVIGAADTATVEECKNYGDVTGKGESVGGIIGVSNVNSIVNQCTNFGDVSSTGVETGGIVGTFYSAGTIKNSTNRGRVYGEKGWVGGVVGWANLTSMITDCENFGEIEGKVESIAGVAGAVGNNSNVSNCTNNGKIIGKGSFIAGVVGWTGEGSTVDKCLNYGGVSEITNNNETGYFIGGVIGSTYYSNTVWNCINYGTVKSQGVYVGGVIGNLGNNSSIYNCLNTGTIEGSGLNDDNDSDVGGVLGGVDSNSTVNSCKNTGDVSGAGKQIGGIVGIITQIDGESGTTITNCYNTAKIKGKSHTGGIIGVFGGIKGTGTIKGCYNIGTILAEEYAGGIIGSSTHAAQDQMSYCYYLSGTAPVGVGNVQDATDIIQLMSMNDMMKLAFATKLNLGTNNGEWIGKDGVYPTLKFEE